MKRADELAQPAMAALRLRNLPIFKISHNLFGHTILLIQKAKASPGKSILATVFAETVKILVR